MLALKQLEFVEDLVTQFERPTNVIAPVLSSQAQYIAMITMLRAVGHTFVKVDCDTDEKKSWAKEAWKEWSREPIFATFIETTRNNLLKEFRGLIDQRNGGFGSCVVYVDPDARGQVTRASYLEAASLQDAAGELVMPRVHEALRFWRRRLAEAEIAFRGFDQ